MRQRLTWRERGRSGVVLRCLVPLVSVVVFLGGCSSSTGSGAAPKDVVPAPTVDEVIAHPEMAGIHRADVVTTYNNDVGMIWGGDLDEFIGQERHYALVLAQCRVIYEMFVDYAETGEAPAFGDPYESAGYPERRGEDEREFSEIDDMARQYGQLLIEGNVEAVRDLLAESCIATVDADDPDSPLIRDQVGLIG